MCYSQTKANADLINACFRNSSAGISFDAFIAFAIAQNTHLCCEESQELSESVFKWMLALNCKEILW